MPLQENPNLANKQRHSQLNAAATEPSSRGSGNAARLLSVMKTKSRSLISAPSELVRHKSHETDTSPEPSDLAVENATTPSSMAQVNGIHKEHSPGPPPGRVISSSMMRSAAISTSDTSPAPAEQPWSSAVGHASTGKSGRVIERLQGDIDRLRREKQLLKVRFEEVEKANETLTTRNQYLQDRNSNYEHTHETNLRQIERRERQVQDLKEELRLEKEKTIRAQEQVQAATANEENWKDQASQAKAIAAQKETEYDTIVTCRNRDNDRYQGGLDKIRANFEILLRQREEDLETQKKLEIIAEQQRQTIGQLEELTKKLTTNFRAYRTEIDSAIDELRSTTSGHDKAMMSKLEEMKQVTGQMRWVLNVEQLVNRGGRPQPEALSEDEPVTIETRREEVLSSPFKSPRANVGVKSKSSRKKVNQAAQHRDIGT